MVVKKTVWVVDDDRSIRWVLEKALARADIPATVFASAEEALNALPTSQPTAVLTDIRMPGMDGLTFVNELHAQYPRLPIVVMTAHSDLDSAVQSYQHGAFEYLAKPFDVDEAVAVLQRALTYAESLQEDATEEEALIARGRTEIIGQAPAMQDVFRAIGRLASSNVTVLITGASGTGKELVAKALHEHSPRARAPFVALNMAAIPSELIESELFGHEKGAFSGAVARRVGHFEQAQGGTLFLDEIGDMPASAQTRLLRVLSSGEFFRVGGHSPVRADVRIIAATHQNLLERVADGRFREDLFHRLNVIRIQLPTLAERAADVPLLARHFLQVAARELNVEPKRLSAAAEALMVSLPWPGNVRQLENTCRWLTVMAPGQEVQVDDFPADLVPRERAVQPVVRSWETALAEWASRTLESAPDTPLLEVAMPAFERTMITAALEKTGGRKKDAALLLGWGRNTLTRKMQELQMQDADTPE
ncbi:MAG: nitrogen regulation protein NR(I) [Pseudomonadales bacterium]|nr:nitrogen regulation protein NR(I) [Pseudomonadales bacterium]